MLRQRLQKMGHFQGTAGPGDRGELVVALATTGGSIVGILHAGVKKRKRIRSRQRSEEKR